MSQAYLLSSRLREVFINGRWIANTNYSEILAGVTHEQAVKKVASLNTIAALTFHINYYLVGLMQVFEGGTLTISDKFSFDLPDPFSPDQWQQLVDDLRQNGARFALMVESMNDENLLMPFVDEKYGNYQRNIEAVIEHSYYHLGQISLLKKMV